MHGDDRHREAVFSYVSPQARIPRTNPMRTTRLAAGGSLDRPLDRVQRPPHQDWAAVDRPRSCFPLS
jgi:hypothetical protein